MNATEMLTDPIRLASLAVMLPFAIRAVARRLHAFRMRRLLGARVRAIGEA